MNRLSEGILKTLRKGHRLVFGKGNFKRFSTEYLSITGDDAADLIKERLLDGKPLMISRFGSVELEALLRLYHIHQERPVVENIRNYLTQKIPPFWWDAHTLKSMEYNAGFFPITKESLEDFGKLYLADIK